MIIHLHILRHGQATHNLEGEKVKAREGGTQAATGVDEHFDALLTDLGAKQARDARPHFHADPQSTQFWVSPLRRAIQTACLAMPKVVEWNVKEDLRERAGRKLCDSRMKKSELKEWCNTSFPHVNSWDMSGVETEHDELYPRPREDAGRIRHRAYTALCEMMQISHTSGVRNFVWVSHSCFLSVLLALLNRCKILDRWLDNGTWRSLVIDTRVTKPYITQRLHPGAPAAIVSFRDHAQFNQVDWTSMINTAIEPSPSYRSHIRAYITHLTTEQVSRQIILVSECLVVLHYPLTSRGCKAKPVPALDVLVRELQNQLVQKQNQEGIETPVQEGDLRSQPQLCDCRPLTTALVDKTPSFVENGVSWVEGIYGEAGDVEVSLERMGMVANNECLIVFERSNTSSDTCEGQSTIFKRVLHIAQDLVVRGAVNNITILQCAA